MFNDSCIIALFFLMGVLIVINCDDFDVAYKALSHIDSFHPNVITVWGNGKDKWQNDNGFVLAMDGWNSQFLTRNDHAKACGEGNIGCQYRIYRFFREAVLTKGYVVAQDNAMIKSKNGMNRVYYYDGVAEFRKV
ncbi:unnamed protein product [Rotaria socialis]|nr:unnamed protein product [Rotaria socialis]CAF3590895.1 unnamed protein product [Rotaria socialis]